MGTIVVVGRMIAVTSVALLITGCAARVANRGSDLPAALYIPPSCMDKVKFTMACMSVSSSVSMCDKVQLTHHCVSVKKESGGNSIPVEAKP